MKIWIRILAFSVLALPSLLPAQWAGYGDHGQPRALLEAQGGGWIIAGDGNIFGISPEGEVVWGQRFGSGPPYANCRKSWLAPDGGVIVAVDGGSGAAATLFKLSASGSVVWEKTYTLAGAVLDVFCPTPDGGAIMAGTLESDLLICRCSANGEIAWQRSYGTGDVDRTTAAAPTSDGGIIVLGSCTPDTSPTSSDLWVLKLASTGEVEWQKRLGGAGDDGATAVLQTADGGYLIAGNSTSFDADGDNLFWLLKLSTAGAIQRQMTFDCYYWGPGCYDLQPATDGSFIAAIALPPQSGGANAMVITIAGDGSIIREKPYSLSGYSFSGATVLPTEDRGCLLSLGGKTTVDDAFPDSLLMKLLPSGEIEWQKIYGSVYSPDAISLLGRAGDGGYVLAGTTSSWTGSSVTFPFTWVMRTAPDGSIGPNCAFIRDASESSPAEVSTRIEVAATVTDTEAAPQSAGLVAEAASIDFVPWGPTELLALGEPTCTLKIHAAGGTPTPAGGSHVYATGTRVQISVSPNPKYEFGEWNGNVTLHHPSATIVMDGGKDIWANCYYVGGPIEKKINELCTVANGIYGDPSHPHVEILRRFRDRYLMASRLGRAFVAFYYRYSSPLAKFIAKRPALRAIGRATLFPVVMVCDLIL